GHLVGDQVQREIERSDTEDHAAREAAGHGEPADAAGVGVEALRVTAVEAAGLLGGPAEDGDGTADLASRPLDRLAVLGGDEPGYLLTALREPLRDVVEGGCAYMGGARRERCLYGGGGRDRLLDLGFGGNADARDDGSVPGVRDL